MILYNTLLGLHILLGLLIYSLTWILDFSFDGLVHTSFPKILVFLLMTGKSNCFALFTAVVSFFSPTVQNILFSNMFILSLCVPTNILSICS